MDNGNYEISIGLPLIFEQVDGNEHKENLKETINYPINSEKIKNLAREIIGDEVSKEIIIDKLLNFVSEYIEDDYENNTTSVFDIIKNKKGDCTEHALLLQHLLDLLVYQLKKYLVGHMILMEIMFCMHGMK